MKRLVIFILFLGVGGISYALEPYYDSLKCHLEIMMDFAERKGIPIKRNMELLSGTDTVSPQTVFDRTMLALGYQKEVCVDFLNINPMSLYFLALYANSSYITIVIPNVQKDSGSFEYNILLHHSFWINKRIHARLHLWNSRTESMVVRECKSKPVSKPNPAADLRFCFYNRRFR